MKILIAEDDQFLGNALRVKLTNDGNEVILANDGAQAIAELEKSVFDLILLDIVMPEKNGFEVLEAVKSSKKNSKTPTAMISNLGQAEDVEKAKKLGAIDFIVKSNVSLAELSEKIKSLIKPPHAPK